MKRCVKVVCRSFCQFHYWIPIKTIWEQYTKSCLASFVFEYLSVQYTYNALLYVQLKLICYVFFLKTVYLMTNWPFTTLQVSSGKKDFS
jgi:hypothetical protein